MLGCQPLLLEGTGQLSDANGCFPFWGLQFAVLWVSLGVPLGSVQIPNVDPFSVELAHSEATLPGHATDITTALKNPLDKRLCAEALNVATRTS